VVLPTPEQSELLLGLLLEFRRHARNNAILLNLEDFEEFLALHIREHPHADVKKLRFRLKEPIS
jgi:hypothetical protein